MPAWLINAAKYVGAFIFEKVLQHIIEAQKKREEKKAAELKRRLAHEEYLAAMKDPSKTQMEREDAFKKFIDSTRPGNR